MTGVREQGGEGGPGTGEEDNEEEDIQMSEWVYFLHPPRENFAATMTDDEVAAWNLHFKWLGGLFEEGQLVLAGATLGEVNTGIAIFEAPDEATARRIVAKDPAAQGGYAQGELRAFEAGLLRGRDR